MSKPRLRTLLLSSAVITTVLPSVLLNSAHAGPQPPHFLTAKGSIVRKVGGKNVRFQLVIEATEFPEYEEVKVTIKRNKKSPVDGSTFTEEHFRAHRLDPGSVVVTDDLKSGSIDTGSQLGSWGRIQVEFNSNGPKTEGCKPSVKKRPGTFTVPPGGEFSFKTGNSVFGTIRKVPQKGFAFEGTCEILALQRGGTCPKPGKFLFGQGTDGDAVINASSSRYQGANKVRVRMDIYRYATMTEYSGDSVLGRVPLDSLKIDSDLHPGVLDLPENVPYLSGKYSLSNPEALESGSPFDCGSGKQAHFDTREGSLAGSLVMKLSGTPTVTLNNTLENSRASTQRAIVEDAP